MDQITDIVLIVTKADNDQNFFKNLLVNFLKIND